jgi:hypothetical protein
LSSFSQISVTITTKNIGSIFFYPKTYFFLPKTSEKEPKHLDKAINDLKKSQHTHTHTQTQNQLENQKPSQV